MFEYIERYFGVNDLPVYKIITYLNDMGKEGWELVDLHREYFINEPNRVCNYNFIFKKVALNEGNPKRQKSRS
jgi:hypothetical protein